VLLSVSLNEYPNRWVSQFCCEKIRFHSFTHETFASRVLPLFSSIYQQHKRCMTYLFTSDFYFSFLQVLVKNCWQSLDRKWKRLKDNAMA
jgi:hypothetical protein